ncbi:MAG: glycosyltransferase family 39 protein [Alphaproteobacteria bacterium]
MRYLALIAFCLFLYLPGIAAVPPLDRDESRFAQATKQMLETRDFVRIQFQDIPRNKKPVGIYWMQAASVSLFGEPGRPAIWPYRLPSVLGATAAVLLAFHFGQGLFGGRTAFAGAALLAGSLLLTAEAHQAKTDAVLLACVVAAQGALGRFYMAKRGGPSPPPGIAVAMTFWLAQGVGILVKGPIVPLISLLTIAALWAWERRLDWLRGLRPLVGLPLAAAIVAPWVVAISSATGGAFVGDAVRSDLLPKLLGAQESHGAPPGYYLLLASLTLWPASLFLWPALVRSWRERATPAVRFCLAWVLPTWVVFEAVPTKLPHYVLPTYPALTLLIAATLFAVVREGSDALVRPRWVRAWYVVWALLGGTLAAAFIVLPLRFGGGISIGAVVAAAGALAAAALPLVRFRRLPVLTAATLGLGGAAVAFVATFAWVMPGLDSLWLSRRVAETVERLAPDRSVAVAAAGYTEPSLVFLLGTGTRLVGGGSAADHVTATPGALAVVNQPEEAAFLSRLSESGRTALLLDTVEGFNYSRGKPAILKVYGVRPEKP